MNCNVTLQPLSEKTPHSGPGALKTEKGRKRRRKEVDVVRRQENKAAEDEYRGNRQGRPSIAPMNFYKPVRYMDFGVTSCYTGKRSKHCVVILITAAEGTLLFCCGTGLSSWMLMCLQSASRHVTSMSYMGHCHELI